MSDDRGCEILEALSVMFAEHRTWELQEGGDGLSEDLKRAMADACQVFLYGGEIPSEVIELVQPLVEFGEVLSELIDVNLHIEDGYPVAEWWAKFEALRNAYNAVRRRAALPKQLEPMAELLETYGDDPRKWLWAAQAYARGDGEGGYIGPFLDEFGNPNIDLIKKEAKEPKSVVPDSSIFQVQAQRKSAASEARANIERLKQRQRDMSGKAPEDPDTIEELLRQGQFPDVIAREKKTTLQDVLAEAERLGIEVADRDAEMAYTPANPSADATNAAAASYGSDSLQVLTGASLDEKVLAIISDHDGAGLTDIARALAKDGFSADSSQIQEIVRALATA